MDYQATLDYLYRFINTAVHRQQRYTGLDRQRDLLAQLGQPQAAYPIVHVTGTKGKGSVGAMSAAMLQAAGYRVGLYASPHLQDFRERFKINKTLITENALVELVASVKPILDQAAGMTWFEIVTALVFEYFRRAQVDIAVIEVGVGGRLDATNVVTPKVSVITSLSFDHMNLLGYTLPEIAREKAGIIKPGVPVVSAPQPAEALQVIETTAAAQGSSLILVGRDWQYSADGGDLRWEHFRAAPAHAPLQAYQTALIGQHQVINSTVALAAMHTLRAQGFAIADEALHKGLRCVNWCGRLEIVQSDPIVVLDAAHNGDSAQWLARTLKERFPAPLTLVFAAKADKDIDGMLAALLPMTDHLLVTQALDSRAESPQVIVEKARVQGYSRAIDVFPTVQEALAVATLKASTVCVTGSVYLVGEARTLYGLEIGQASYLKREHHGICF